MGGGSVSPNWLRAYTERDYQESYADFCIITGEAKGVSVDHHELPAWI